MTDSFISHWIKDIETYRKGPLVYLRTLKCASTYYSEEFKRNGWIQESFEDINWEKDHVFSFIMDPLDRRIKGLAEFITMYPKTECLLDQPSIFWQKLACLDLHSVPYHLTYHGYVRKIDWIPIDNPNYTSEELVIKLCRYHNIDLRLSEQKKHVADEKKKSICQTISALTGNGSGELYLSLELDQYLYHEVTLKVDYQKDTWDLITWLR